MFWFPALAMYSYMRIFLIYYAAFTLNQVCNYGILVPTEQFNLTGCFPNRVPGDELGRLWKLCRKEDLQAVMAFHTPYIKSPVKIWRTNKDLLPLAFY